MQGLDQKLEGVKEEKDSQHKQLEIEKVKPHAKNHYEVEDLI